MKEITPGIQLLNAYIESDDNARFRAIKGLNQLLFAGIPAAVAGPPRGSGSKNTAAGNHNDDVELKQCIDALLDVADGYAV
jgi:hypothetical protein